MMSGKSGERVKQKEEIMKLNDLERLIPQYIANKTELDSYQKICDKEKAKIKSIMKDFSLLRYEVGGYKALYTISKRESMNEEMLLAIAHEHGLNDIIKTKEYIDYDALEKALYDGKISDDVVLEMDKAKEVKEIVTLRVIPIKEKKKEDE